ncbi:hypothetical protein VWY34_07830 [Phaeobacter sp. JH20_02]|uniref:hypothetical protein n=1 Tax=Phaeobacter TaxID=302485 RepID=UPI003A840907
MPLSLLAIVESIPRMSAKRNKNCIFEAEKSAFGETAFQRQDWRLQSKGHLRRRLC